MQMNGVCKNVDHFCQLQCGNETKHMCRGICIFATIQMGMHSHLNSCKNANEAVGKHYESSSMTDL